MTTPARIEKKKLYYRDILGFRSVLTSKGKILKDSINRKIKNSATQKRKVFFYFTTGSQIQSH